MRQNRNIYPNYPVYPMPTNPNMNPGAMPMPMPMPNYESSDKIMEEINQLKRRVTALEKTVNHNNYNSTKFNDSNYHMM